MENKFKYFLVGLFLILFVALFVVVLLFLYKGFNETEYETYLIKTTYSVSGLEIGSPVKYKGVNVGKVRKVEVNWENPSEILILVDVDKRLKITDKIYATLGLQGITGLAYISLEESDKALPVKKEGEYYVIPFRASTFQEISDFVPTMLSEAYKLTKDLRSLINSIDTKAINGTFKTADETLKNLDANLSTLTLSVIKLQEDASSLMSKSKETLENTDKLIFELQKTAEDSRITLQELRELAKETRSQLPEVSKKLDNLSERLEKLIRDTNKFVNRLNKSPSELLTKEKTAPAPFER